MENLSASEKRDLAQMKFPNNFDEPVDMEKVNWEVVRNWMIKKLDQYLPDDDIVAEFALELFKVQHPNIKSIQLQLKGFLESDAELFCSQVWDLLLSAQNDAHGIPEQLLEEKKQQIVKEREERLNQERREAARRRGMNDSRPRTYNSNRDRNRGVKKEEYKKESTPSFDNIKDEDRREGHDTYMPNYSAQDRQRYRAREGKRSPSRDIDIKHEKHSIHRDDSYDDRDELGRDRSRRAYYREHRNHDGSRNRSRSGSRSQSPSRSRSRNRSSSPRRSSEKNVKHEQR